MADVQEMFDALCEPFPVEAVSWRIGSTNAEKTKAKALCYIDARNVMDRLDSVCGPQWWQCNYTVAPGAAIICNIGIKLGEWVWKADGAGATDVEGEKGMMSDAFKRAAVRWGIGRYLYELDSPWMPIEQHGRSSVFTKEATGQLNHFYEQNAPKTQWGVRGGIQAYRLLVKGLQHFVSQPSDAAEFEESNRGLIAGLPVAMRKHFMEQLARVGATQKEAAE